MDAKNKIHSIIGHDLRAPFNTLIGFSDLLIENLKEEGQLENRKYAEVLKRISVKNLELLDNLLIYARNLESKSEFSMSEIPINQLITDTIQALQPSVELKKIMISHTVGPSAKIMGIKDLLATMIRNILSNAIKFTEDQGAIEVSTRITKNFVDIIIKDNGIGMNNDLISNIFENSKSRPGTVGETGKGYGLMLSKEVAEKHEGNISVSSIPEKGTIFTIKLPLFKA